MRRSNRCADTAAAAAGVCIDDVDMMLYDDSVSLSSMIRRCAEQLSA